MIGKITFLSGANEKHFLLFRNMLTVGRNPSNDLKLAFPSVSRNHAKITAEEGIFYITDLKSNNGTFLNGKIVTDRVRLSEGDVIRIANTEMKFEVLDDSEADQGSLNKLFADYSKKARSTVTSLMDIKNVNLQSIFKKIKRQL